jgi:zinc protease
MERISFEKLTLPNGLQVILHQDKSLPLVSVNVWYHVGSKDEEPGRTGLAHLFEHLMFEGSKHHNSSHFGPLQEVGASLNGSTNTDRTNYWENVPSNYLELALWLEADRMGFLLDALDQSRLDIQRDVVKNERRQSYENRPYGLASLELEAAIYPNPHPYHWPVIGFMKDLDAASLEDTHAFHRRYYAPSNASLAIAGDFETSAARGLVERYFADLPGGTVLPTQAPMESPLQNPVNFTLYDRVTLPRWYLAWPSVPRFHRDEAALSVLASILGDGKSSRLHQHLVYDARNAQSVSSDSNSAELAGNFTVEATVALNFDPEKVIEEARSVIEDMRREPPTQEEMARVKNRIEWSHVRQTANVGGFGGRANRLNAFNIFAGDPDLLNTDLDRFLSVSADEVWRVANDYLNDRQVQLIVLPEPTPTQRTERLDRTVQPPPGELPSFTPPLVQRARLDNGVEIMVVERRSLAAVAFSVLLPKGAATDPVHSPGLASMTGAMLQEGTDSRTSRQIAGEIEFIGSRLTVATGREQTSLSMSTLTREWPRALELVADLLIHPTFPDDELARVRTRRLGELRRLRDDARALADRESTALVYGKDSAYGHPVSGTETSVEAMTRDEIRGHFQGNFGPVGAVLAVVGDISLEQAVELAQGELGGWTEARKKDDGRTVEGGTNLDDTTIHLIDKSGAAQSVIRAALLGVPRGHVDYFPLTVLDQVFGGQFTARLNMNLRQDKGYSYGYRSWIDWHRGSSLLVAGGSVETAVTALAVEETLREFEAIHGGHPVTEEEFQAAKAALLRRFPSTFETPWQVLGHLTPMVEYGLPDDYMATYPSQIEGVSLSDVRRAADQHVNHRRVKVLVVGDRTAVEPGLRDLGYPLVTMDGGSTIGDPGTSTD